jgi:hypothetical protein
MENFSRFIYSNFFKAFKNEMPDQIGQDGQERLFILIWIKTCYSSHKPNFIIFVFK